jgi:hypothetical protein
VAALQLRGDSYRLIFQYHGQQQSCTLGEITETEAQQCKTRCEQLLMRVKQGLIEVPPGVAIADFILCDGKPPVDPALALRKQTTLQELRIGYLDIRACRRRRLTAYSARTSERVDRTPAQLPRAIQILCATFVSTAPPSHCSTLHTPK